MAHELEFLEDGRASFAYAANDKTAPWHGLGTRVSNDLTPREMLVAAGLDWQVEKFDNYALVNGKYLKNGEQALVRTSDNKILAPSVGENWEPLQNEEAFEFFHQFVKAGDMEMNTAGSLQGGRHIWALARIKESFTILGKDRIDSYLLLSSPHVYGKSITADFTGIRVVCNNTLTLALNQKSNKAVTINHRQKFDPERVKELLGIAHTKLERYEEAASFLASKRYSDDKLVEFMRHIFPATGDNKKGAKFSKNGETAMHLLETQPGAEFAPGTWWNAYNSITYMVDHTLCRDADTRLFHSWLGGHVSKKREALEKAIELAQIS